MSATTRRVLMIGGLMDQKWHTHIGGGYKILIPKPAKFSYKMADEAAVVAAPLPEYEEYMLEHVALYGEGVWVGMHNKILYGMEEELVGPPEAHVRMILRAILQRDVATALGL